MFQQLVGGSVEKSLGCLLALPPESWEALLGPVLDECLRYLICKFAFCKNTKKTQASNGWKFRTLDFFFFWLGILDWAALTKWLRWNLLLAVARQEGNVKELQPGVNSHPIYQPFNHFGSSLIKHPINTIITQGCIFACAATASVANGNTPLKLYIHSYASRSGVVSLSLQLLFFSFLHL